MVRVRVRVRVVSQACGIAVRAPQRHMLDTRELTSLSRVTVRVRVRVVSHVIYMMLTIKLGLAPLCDVYNRGQ